MIYVLSKRVGIFSNGIWICVFLVFICSVVINWLWWVVFVIVIGYIYIFVGFGIVFGVVEGLVSVNLVEV